MIILLVHMKLISFQCPDEIIEYIEDGMKKGRWASISDAIRDLLRDIVKEEKSRVKFA